MAYQFIHIDSFSRQAGKGKASANSVQDIINEVTRKPDDCKHVEKPQPPILLFGVDPLKLPALCENYATSMSSNFIRKNRKTGFDESVSRKMRADGLTMIGGVFSAPAEMPVGLWPDYRSLMIETLNHEFGNRLKSVVEHFDEEYRHCHFYVVPNHGEHFDTVHPGKRAAALMDQAGELKGKQNAAYIAAMRQWQDDYWEKVSSKFALARIGPKRQRLTRAEYKAQQSVLKANAEAMHIAEDGLVLLQVANEKLKQNENLVQQNLKITAELETKTISLEQKSKEIQEMLMEVYHKSADCDVKLNKIANESSDLDERTAKFESEAQDLALKTEGFRVASMSLDKELLGVKVKSAEVDAKAEEIESLSQSVYAKQAYLLTFGGWLATITGSVTITILAAKDWFVERGVWPGVKRSHIVEQHARISIAKRDQALKELHAKVNTLQQKIERQNQQEKNVANLQQQLKAAKTELVKVEGYNAELAIENNDLKRTIKNDLRKK